ncbi:MAG: DUF2232 domain-containing protein [Halanaerobiaceae bacterium]
MFDTDLQKDFLKAIGLLILFTYLILIPLIGVFIYIIWPIPVVYLILKYDSKKALYAILISALLNIIIFGLGVDVEIGIMFGVNSIIGYGLIGFLLGSAFKEKLSSLKSVLVTIGSVLISNIIILYVFINVYMLNFNQEINNFKTLLEESLPTEQLPYTIDEYMESIKLLMPSIILISSIITGLLIYYTTIWYLQKKKISVKKYKPIIYWKLPGWWISTGLLFIVLIRYNISLLGLPVTVANNVVLVANNLIIILLFLIVIEGFSVLLYFLLRLNSKFINILFVLLFIFFRIIIIPGLLFLGFLDFIFNFRKHKL